MTDEVKDALGEWTSVQGLIEVARQRAHPELKNVTYPGRSSAEHMRALVRDLANVCEALASATPRGEGVEAVAWIKAWIDNGGAVRRVLDFDRKTPPWLEGADGYTVTPLYASPSDGLDPNFLAALPALEQQARTFWSQRQEACAITGADLSMPNIPIRVDWFLALVGYRAPPASDGLAKALEEIISKVAEDHGGGPGSDCGVCRMVADIRQAISPAAGGKP